MSFFACTVFQISRTDWLGLGNKLQQCRATQFVWADIEKEVKKESTSRPKMLSLAISGGSQHHLGLTKDADKQKCVANCIKALEDNGWFRTVRFDIIYFTYLGYKESELPGLGLKKVKCSDNFTYWVPNIASYSVIRTSSLLLRINPAMYIIPKIKNLFFAIIVTVCLLDVNSFTQSIDSSNWQKLNCKLNDRTNINGMVLISKATAPLKFLVLIDHPHGAATLTIDNKGRAECKRLENWNGIYGLEALTAIPGADDEFIAAHQDGKFYRLKLTNGTIRVSTSFDLPTTGTEYEGFALQRIGGTDIVAAWATRGSNETDATIYWGTFDPKTNHITHDDLQQVKIRAPYLKSPEIRHISDLKIRSDGEVLVVGASDPNKSDDAGPFASVFYSAGRFFMTSSNKLNFCKPGFFESIMEFDKRKTEALEILPDGRMAFATDDEAEGTYFLLK